jgi:hypothetical protein
MRRECEHQPNPDRLPERSGADLRATDHRLARLARTAADRIPGGLADRVYHASVGALPVAAPSDRRTKPGRRAWQPGLAGTRRDWRLVATGWGRLGLAAALGVAFVVAGVVLEESPAPVGEVAAIDMGWLDEDPLDHVDAQVAYILDTGSLSSLDEITGELRSMIASSGM